MDNVMEKLASLPPSGQIFLMADTMEKVAAERDVAMEKLNELAAERELDELYHRLEKTGQLPAQWGDHESSMAELRKIAAGGKLEALKASLDVLPGSFPKVAAGLSSETGVGDDEGATGGVKESRRRFEDLVKGGADD